MPFGETLRSIRLERRLKQSDLATNGISRQLISLFESGERLPSYENLEYFARKLDVSVSVFFDNNIDEKVNKLLLILYKQGNFAEKEGRWSEALECWDNLLELCRSYNNTHKASHAQWHKGLAQCELGQWHDALNTLLPLLVQREFPNSDDTMYPFLQTLARCYRELGQNDHSITFFSLASSLVSPSDERWLRMHINIGSGYLLMGDLQHAERYFEESIEAAKKCGDGHLEVWALLGWVTTHLNRGMIDHVEGRLQRIQKLSDNLGMSEIKTELKHARVVLHRLAKEWNQALTLLDECLAIKKNNVEALGQLLHEKILIAAGTKNRVVGDEALTQIEALPNTVSSHARIWLAIAEYYLAFDNYHAASGALRRARAGQSSLAYDEASSVLALVSKFSPTEGAS